MIATCVHCGAAHELDPPAWQVAAGRSFNLVCPACGQASVIRPQVYVREDPSPGLPLEVHVLPPTPAPDAPVDEDDHTEETQPPLTEEAPTEHDEAALEAWALAMSEVAQQAREAKKREVEPELPTVEPEPLDEPGSWWRRLFRR